MERQINVVKADGEREFFDRRKLENSLHRVGADGAIIKKIVDHIEGEIVDGISTSDIYHHAFDLLKKFQRPVATRYSLRRALIGLGPTGFPFELFISEIFKAQGYATLTDQIVQGHCVPHEIDVVAFNDQKLVMSEIKFHNELGFKTDLKVALYVKARVDDLKQNTFMYGGKQRPLDEAWLITNTKFTQTAIDYGTCVGLKMIGWNYPESGGHLEDLIEKNKLHPVSCLLSLSVGNKQELYRRGVVLCSTLKTNPAVLREIGLTESKTIEVQQEVESLS